MKKSLYFLMVVGLAGGLVACGGGSSSADPGDTADDITDDRDAGPAIVNTEPLEGLWMISSDFESTETLSSGEMLFEQGQVLKVFQIASTGVQGEIEVIECSRDFWDSGEVVSFVEPGNDYDGSVGQFLLNEPRILFFADGDATFDATIISNTEIAFSPYDLDLPLSEGATNISGTANNIVAYKVSESIESSLGSISYKTENFDVLCAQVIASETRIDSAQGNLVSQDLGFIADGVNYVDGVINKKTRLLISDQEDETAQVSKYGFIGGNPKELEEFFDNDVELLLDEDLSFSGSLGSSVTFEGDIKNIVGE